LTPENHAGLDRREVLRGLVAGVGAAASALWVSELVVFAEEQALHAHVALATSAQAPAFTPKVLVGSHLETVAVLSELIIPTTDTPGGRAAGVDRFVDYTLDAATPAVRAQFLAGLGWLDGRSKTLFGSPFAAATPAQQIDLLTRISSDDAVAREGQTGAEFFVAIKAMTITGYYSSEIGLRQELGDSGQLVLAAFEGCTHKEHQ
jgi:hypothetical protein